MTTKCPNNPIWVMSSVFPSRSLEEVIERTKAVGAQGVEVCVFRHDGARNDHIATHLDYKNFSPKSAQAVIDLFNKYEFGLSVGAYENLLGGADPVGNQNHILGLIRIAALLGGDENDVKVGTFVGYNHEIGWSDRGFEKNLEEYERVFKPIVKYAEDLGVTIVYENCPMEGLRPATAPTTFNNLAGCLAARKLMYALIPSKAHGETYDPSHDIWQNINPSDVLKASDPKKILRIHIKGSRNLNTPGRIAWGALYPQQQVSKELAKKAGVPIAENEWDRHHYEPTLPGYGGSDSIDWREFVETAINELNFRGPFGIENEAALSKGTGNVGAMMQGLQATVLNISPLLWPLVPEKGYVYDSKARKELKPARTKDIPIVTMDSFK